MFPSPQALRSHTFVGTAAKPPLLSWVGRSLARTWWPEAPGRLVADSPTRWPAAQFPEGPAHGCLEVDRNLGPAEYPPSHLGPHFRPGCPPTRPRLQISIDSLHTPPTPPKRPKHVHGTVPERPRPPSPPRPPGFVEGCRTCSCCAAPGPRPLTGPRRSLGPRPARGPPLWARRRRRGEAWGLFGPPMCPPLRDSETPCRRERKATREPPAPRRRRSPPGDLCAPASQLVANTPARC